MLVGVNIIENNLVLLLRVGTRKIRRKKKSNISVHFCAKVFLLFSTFIFLLCCVVLCCDINMYVEKDFPCDDVSYINIILLRIVNINIQHNRMLQISTLSLCLVRFLVFNRFERRFHLIVG